MAIPLTAQLVDQQAALAGSGAVRPGELKATYGTGVFVLGRTEEPVAAGGLLPTVAWARPGRSGEVGEVAHALDGGVFAAGSLLDWLAEGLGLAVDAPALAAAAAGVQDSAGVIVLPGPGGARRAVVAARGPRCDRRAAPGGRPAHVARAALEAIAWRVADIVEAMAEVVPVASLRVDGGLSNDETLLQIQADALGLPLAVGRADATVLGAAMLAGVGAGVFASVATRRGAAAPGRASWSRAPRPERLASAAALARVRAGERARRPARRHEPTGMTGAPSLTS